MSNERLARTEYVETYADWVRQAAGSTGGRLLEIGAHAGEFVRASQARGFSVVGLDIDALALSRASPRMAAVQGDAQRLPLATGSFAVVVMFDVIEHLGSPFAAVSEIRRVLAPGGHLFLTTPNVNAVDRYVHPTTWSGIADPTHLYLFSARSLSHLVVAGGLRDVKIRTPFHGVGPTLRCLLAPTGLGGQLWLHARTPASSRGAPSARRQALGTRC